MKHIIKFSEPVEFTTWKSAHPDATYAALSSPHYPDSRRIKSVLRKSLCEEQHGLCCYCERRIISGDYHIEHFRPKAHDKFPHLQLEYTNLHASCHREPSGGKDECCGHKKKDEFDIALISPLESDCSIHFSFGFDGSIKGEDERGEKTIKMLNLNSSLLRDSRKNLIDYFIDLKEEELSSEISSHLNLSHALHGEYYTMIKYLHQKGLL